MIGGPGDRPSGLHLPRAEDGLRVECCEAGVALVWFDQPGAPHNRFTPELLERFDALLDELRRGCVEGSVKGVVLTSAKAGSFIVGVDVAAIASVADEAAAVAATRRGQAIFGKLEALPVPTVAAINGTCLGGATEMALACGWRLAADGTDVEIGLPEVNLGIFPGFGGSQRLPRTISLERALPMILGGRSVSAARALRIGLIDAVVPSAVLLDEARRHALRPAPPRRRRAPEDRPPARRVRRWLLEGQPPGRAAVFRRARKDVLERSGGHYPAPVAALDTIQRGTQLPLDEALRIEAERVGALIVSPESRNLVSVFRARQDARRLAKDAGDSASRPSAGVADVHKLGVVGAGVMGGGIAQLAAYREIAVRLKDVAPEALTAAYAVAYERFRRGQRAGKIGPSEVGDRMALISATLEYSGFAAAELVLEAVVEDADIKRGVLAEIEVATRSGAVLATNTSSLTLAELGTALQRPERLVGLHFFNPVHRMPLVEVARAEGTANDAVDVALRLAQRLGKVPVVVADSPGFLVNRVLTPYLNEGLLLLEAGCSVTEIDSALEHFGMPIGPLRLLDEIGLDVADQVAARLGPVFDRRLPVSGAGRKMRQAGRLGRKAGGGFYRYHDGEPRPGDVAGILGATPRAAAAGTDEITDRCVLLLLNEACYALQERIVTSPAQLDLAMVMGTGFAPFRGGILHHADSAGVAALCHRMERLAESHGLRFEPAPLLREVAEGSGSFFG